MSILRVSQHFGEAIAHPEIFEAALYVENDSGDYSEALAYNKNIDTPTIIASISKMFTTAIVLKLIDAEIISFDTKLADFFDKTTLNGLHVFEEGDYSKELTIANLLFMTSGLPDFFSAEVGEMSMQSILEKDRAISFEEIISAVKREGAHFAPDSDRAFYSDVNFDLLGVLIENLTKRPINDVFKKLIFDPLGMEASYVPTGDSTVPMTYYGDKLVSRALYNKSCPASAGCVSTLRDLMTFSKAFWTGKIFAPDLLLSLAKYRRIQFGMFWYGGGHMQLRPAKIMDGFARDAELVGHSGSTGSFMYYYPMKRIHIVGDLTQVESPPLATQLAIKVAQVH